MFGRVLCYTVLLFFNEFNILGTLYKKNHSTSTYICTTLNSFKKGGFARS